MKKALALILSAMMALASIPTFALELEAPEAAAEAKDFLTEADLSATYTPFAEPTNDATYGKLI